MTTYPKLTGGYLEIIIGPMFSGRTTAFVDLYNFYLIYDLKLKIGVINYAEDTRYDNKMLSTHDKKMIPCTWCKNIREIFETDEIQNADIVLINEGQFFPDLYETVFEMVEKMNKRVHICGLDGNFKRKKFGTLLDLIPICDNIMKLTSQCNCGNPALFSYRITNETDEIVIGSNNYIPLCRSCYNKKTH